jgi:hypothetical protein
MFSFAFSLFRSTSEESLKQLQNANAAQQQAADTAMMERDALTVELKQGNGRGVPMTPVCVVPLALTFLFRFPPARYRNCEALRGKCQSGTGQKL